MKIWDERNISIIKYLTNEFEPFARNICLWTSEGPHLVGNKPKNKYQLQRNLKVVFTRPDQV